MPGFDDLSILLEPQDKETIQFFSRHISDIAFYREAIKKYGAPRVNKQGKPCTIDITRAYVLCKIEPVINKHITQFIDILRNNETFYDAFIRRNKVRSRIGGYIFGCLIQNCRGSDFSDVDKVFSVLQVPFNYEAEILCDDWQIPISGCLYDDIRTNFVAKACKKMEPDKFLELIELMLNIISEQVLRAIKTSLAQYATIPDFLRITDDPDQLYDSMYELFCDNDNIDSISTAKKEIREGIATMYLLRIYNEWITCGEGNQSADFEILGPANRATSVDNEYLPYNSDLSTVDRRMVHTGKANNGPLLAGYQFDMPTSTDFLYSAESWKTVNKTITPTAATDIRNACIAATMCDRERYELESQRAIIKSRNKANRAEQKAENTAVNIKKIADLQSEVESLKAALEKERSRASALDAQRMKAESENCHLKTKTAKLKAELNSAKNTLEKTQSIQQALEQESDVLRAIIAEKSETIPQEKEKEALDTSIFDQLNVVCYGGFPAWINGMKDLHPNITFYDKTGHMPESAIAAADVVWLQVNHINHPAFYRIINTAKNLNKPIKYFTHAGHVACRQQIIQETSLLNCHRQS